MLECTGCLHAWLLFWADAELITAADDLCEVVIPWEYENHTGAKTKNEDWKVKVLALEFATICVTLRVESKSSVIQVQKPVTPKENR